MLDPETRDRPAAEIASFAAGLTYADLPTDAIRSAERAFVDTVGVTLAGSTEGAGSRTMDVAATEPGASPLLGQDETVPLSEAVFANATAGHALDFDDTALAATDGHPSVPMIAPLLVVGEREGATGAEVLTAYVAGFEAQAYLNAPISPSHYEAGWHATATIGTFGAAVATASLLDLPADEIETALNIAASMAAGLKRNFGSMTKPVHAGQAARSGVTAARLAAAGIDADEDAISDERGFYDLYGGDSSVDLSNRHELGEEWRLVEDGFDVKKYACCYYTHAAIYGTTLLANEHEIDPESVESIRIAASQGAMDAVVHDDPTTSLQAKFSMPYLVAYALVNGTVDLTAFEEASLTDSRVRELADRVTFVVDDERSYDWFGASITVEMTDGSLHELTQETPPGTHEDPLSDDELRGKFEMCATRVLDDSAIATAHERLDSLRTVDDVSTLFEVL